MLGVTLLCIALFLFFKPKYRYLSYFLYLGFMLGTYGGFGLLTDSVLGVKNKDLAIVYTFAISLYLVLTGQYKLPNVGFIRWYKLFICFLICSIFFSHFYYGFSWIQILQGGRDFILIFSLPIFMRIKPNELNKLMPILLWITIISSVLYILQVVMGRALMPYSGEPKIDPSTGLVRLYNSPVLLNLFLALTFVVPNYFGRKVNLLLKTALYHKTSISTANFWIEQGENRWIFCRHGIEKAFKHSYIRLYFGLINFRAGSTLYSHQILKDHNFDTALSRYEDAKHIYGIIRNKKIAYTPTCVMTYSLDKKDGLSHKVKDISKDFIFNMDFSNKTFWECMLLGNLLNQGYSLYPEHKNILKEKYSKYVFYRYLDLAIEFFKIKQIIKRIGLY